MSTGAIIGVIVAAIVVVALGWFLWTQMRSRKLRGQYGPEYDRALEEGGSKRAAERELLDREKRHSSYEIKSLAPEERDRYAQQWALIQEQFVDHPGSAVAEADRLVTVVMGERGYPTEGYEQQASDLSVHHASTLEHYRTAHDIKDRHSESRADTEELREAMVHYRSLFRELLDSDTSGRK